MKKNCLNNRNLQGFLQTKAEYVFYIESKHVFRVVSKHIGHIYNI